MTSNPKIERWFKEVQSKCPHVRYELKERLTYYRIAICKLTGLGCSYLRCKKKTIK